MSDLVTYRLCGVTLQTDWPIATHIEPGLGPPDLRFSVADARPGPGQFLAETPQVDEFFVIGHVICGPGAGIGVCPYRFKMLVDKISNGRAVEIPHSDHGHQVGSVPVPVEPAQCLRLE